MRFNTGIVLFILAVGVGSTPANAQIVNTLRGFDAKEMGWSGGLEGAVAVADGNTDYFEYEVTGAAQHQGTHNRWRFIARTMRRTADGSEIAESRIGHIRHNYRLGASRYATLAFLQGQYEPFKHIQQRYLAGAGAQMDLYDKNLWQSVLGGSIMYENEELTATDGQRTTDARFSFFLSVFRDVEDGLSVDVVGFYQPRADDFGDMRGNLTLGTHAFVVGELYIFARYVVEYDSEPAPGIEDLDQNLRAGLGYKF